jgi:para-nitrobenzyl esterase
VVSAARTVRVESGALTGVESADGEVRAFLGVPYAAPPIGDLRWRPPQPAPAWEGLRQATRFATDAPQSRLPIDSIYAAIQADVATSEDCLHLNVWTGGEQAFADRPVMVWLHPGAYQFGSGSSPLYDGTALARAGVTLVTVNHRLNRFGFLAHPWLSDESGHGASGNYGLMDVVAALEWVQRNIGQFSGDRDNVTVFGASAGGNSVHNLRAMPSARGLFHRAIAQSAPGVGPVLDGFGHALGPSTLAAGEQAGRELSDALGVSSLTELRRVPAAEIEAVLLPRAVGDWRFKILPGAQVSTHVFDSGYPVIDGHVLPRSPIDVYRAGDQIDVPVMIGNTSNESAPLPYLSTVTEYRRFLAEEFGSFAQEAFALYPAADDVEVERVSATLDADRTFVWSNWTAAHVQQQTGSAPVWHYWFDRAAAVPETFVEKDYAGAFHLAEIPYIFGTLDSSPRAGWAWSSGDRELARQISAAWVNFARTGDPNGDGVPRWPVFDPHEPSTLVWDVQARVADPLDHARMEFLDRFNAVWDGTPASVASSPHARQPLQREQVAP